MGAATGRNKVHEQRQRAGCRKTTGEEEGERERGKRGGERAAAREDAGRREERRKEKDDKNSDAAPTRPPVHRWQLGSLACTASNGNSARIFQGPTHRVLGADTKVPDVACQHKRVSSCRRVLRGLGFRALLCCRRDDVFFWAEAEDQISQEVQDRVMQGIRAAPAPTQPAPASFSRASVL